MCVPVCALTVSVVRLTVAPSFSASVVRRLKGVSPGQTAIAGDNVRLMSIIIPIPPVTFSLSPTFVVLFAQTRAEALFQPLQDTLALPADLAVGQRLARRLEGQMIGQ